MKISIILAHPNRESFNHAIAQTAIESLRENGHDIFFHDLYKENFDPLLQSSEFLESSILPETISTHCAEIAEADGIIIIHPNWWGQPPAILKGWIDRVLRPGVAYEFLEDDSGEGVPHGLLKAKTAIVFNTSNTEPTREMKVFGDPLETIWKNCIFDLCGITNFHRRTFSIVISSSESLRHEWLNIVKKDINLFFHNEYNFNQKEITMNNIETAVQKFSSGYNCAQSVLFALSNDSVIDKNSALKIAWGFGAGMGRQQEVCGAITGGIMAIGLKYGGKEDERPVVNEKIYAKTKELMDKFQAKHGSCLCRELLKGCNLQIEEGQKFFRENDLKNKVCMECVRSAVQIVEEMEISSQ